MMKREFQFRLDNNSIAIKVDEAKLRKDGYTEDYIATRLQQQLSHYSDDAFYEKKWRNAEYVATDYMLLPYSRYKGEVLSGSTKLQDIIEYRDALYNYRYDTVDPRPIRPTWFEDNK